MMQTLPDWFTGKKIFTNLNDILKGYVGPTPWIAPGLPPTPPPTIDLFSPFYDGDRLYDVIITSRECTLYVFNKSSQASLHLIEKRVPSCLVVVDLGTHNKRVTQFCCNKQQPPHITTRQIPHYRLRSRCCWLWSGRLTGPQTSS